MGELTKRIIFGVIAAPLGVAIIYFGDAALATLIGVVQALGAWEFYRMSRATISDPRGYPFSVAGSVVAALVPIALHAHMLGVINVQIMQWLPLFVLLPFAAALWLRWPGKPFVAISTTVLGVLYVSMLAYIYPIRHHEYIVEPMAGAVLVVLPVMLTWATDIGAYAFGRLFGRRKLMPAVSPAKTVAGAVGGLLLTVLVCWLYVELALKPYAQLAMTTFGVLLFGVSISVVAQIGDLVESMLKRDAGVKDSSTILPGHGDILDRFDSMIFVMPVAYVLLGWLLIPAPR